MSKARTQFSLLQATAVVSLLALVVWSIGLPSFRFAEAANVTSFSDTLSDSAPSALANHTLNFVTLNGVAAGGSIVVTFPAGFDPSFLDFEDIDLIVNSSQVTLDSAPDNATWGVTTSGNTIEFTSDTGVIASSATVTIAVGTNAVEGATGDTQIQNPASPISYEIEIAVGQLDSGATRVAIINTVEVSAAVQTSMEVTIAGIGPGFSINGASTTGSTTATAIPFGTLTNGVASTAAQQISVATNASNGFVVTVQTDGQLLSATGADIDGFSNGTYVATPTAWSSPLSTLGNENTYGHWGITTNDASVSPSLTDTFNNTGAGQRYVSASTTPVEVFRHDGPSDGVTSSVGRTQVGYRVQIGALQEAGDDYTATLTYVATPVF